MCISQFNISTNRKQKHLWADTCSEQKTGTFHAQGLSPVNSHVCQKKRERWGHWRTLSSVQEQKLYTYMITITMRRISALLELYHLCEMRLGSEQGPERDQLHARRSEKLWKTLQPYHWTFMSLWRLIIHCRREKRREANTKYLVSGCSSWKRKPLTHHLQYRTGIWAVNAFSNMNAEFKCWI